MHKPDSLIAGIIVFFIALFVYTKLAGPIPLFINSIQTTKSNLFQVSGDGQVAAPPDMAMITFGVTKQSGSVTDATDQTNKAIAKILSAVKNQGIEDKDIITTDYSVNPNYDYTSSAQNITGYTVSQNIQVKITPIDKASKILDTVTQMGANVVDGASFTFQDATKQQLEDKARKMAVDAAKAKATSLASAAGLRLGPIINVDESAQEPMPIRFAAIGAKVMDAGIATAPTQLPTGESTVTSTITLTYETY